MHVLLLIVKPGKQNFKQLNCFVVELIDLDLDFRYTFQQIYQDPY